MGGAAVLKDDYEIDREFISLTAELPKNAIPYLIEDLRDLLNRSGGLSGSLERTASFLRSIENK